jgi:molybdate transport system substrate-binding protein
MVRLILLFLLWLPLMTAASETLNIAVAASFRPVIEQLAPRFEQKTGIKVQVSSASSGVLTQQIIAGAPFDLFFSADAKRPEAVAEVLQLPASSVQAYALGTLVLISTEPTVLSVSDLADYQGKVILANPQHAPYGVAAAEVLDHVGFQGDRVQANNVAQARQYISLALAPVGLIAQSVATDLAPQFGIGPSLYSDIVQKRVVVQSSDRVNRFLEYLKLPGSVQVIESFGYRVPSN